MSIIACLVSTLLPYKLLMFQEAIPPYTSAKRKYTSKNLQCEQVQEQ